MKKAAQRLDELPQVGRDVIAISVWIEKTVVAAPARRECRTTWRRPGAAFCTARA